MSAPTFVGIDPAIAHNGLVIVRPGGESLAITLKSPKLARVDRDPHTWSSRIEIAASTLASQVPIGSLVAIEGPAYGAKFGNPDERAGLRWSLIARLRVRECRVVVIPPTKAKMWLTDSGVAKKDEMIASAQTLARRYLPDLAIETEHEADAFALVSMLAAMQGSPIFPPRTRGDEALAGVAWEHLNTKGK